MADIGIILGSGLNAFSGELSHKNLIYEDKSGIHHKKICLGKLDGKELIVFEGRNHFYEKAGHKRIFFNVEKAKEFGIKLLIITNAAGGINKNFHVSDLMLIISHINLINRRFASKQNSGYYNKATIANIGNIALRNNITLHKGVYCASPGPMYETKSEISFVSKIGADAVGMSTVPEIIYANNFGIETVAISCITNLLSKNKHYTTNHEEVLEAGAKAYSTFSKFVKLIISSYPFKN
jgi:purine-nucleoside phosphorylase